MRDEQFFFGGHARAAEHHALLWSPSTNHEEVPRQVQDSFSLVVYIPEHNQYCVFPHDILQGVTPQTIVFDHFAKGGDQVF